MYKKCEEILNKLESEGKIKISDYQFPPKQELKLKLKDMLEDFVSDNYFLTNEKIKRIETTTYVEIDEKYYLSNKMKNYISKQGTANFKNPDCKINLDVARPLTTDPNKRAGTTNYICKELPSEYNICDMDLKEYKIRKLTPKEYWRLMGFDDEDFEKASRVNSNTQLYKQAGNSIVVNVLMTIFKELIKCLPTLSKTHEIKLTKTLI